ncbi:hypothetical protein C8R43DRAFT_893291 [Mycena crocata]|nr:hypothetical protein C8R43DRAFT_893291 [Mycena crocata]
MYLPYWKAPSLYSPGHNGTKPVPECSKDQLHYLSNLLGRNVLSLEARIGYGVYNAVYSLGMDSEDTGPDCVARICYNFKDDHKGREFAQSMTKKDVAALELVASFVPDLPIPRVLGHNTDLEKDVNPIGAPFILQSRLNGINLLNTAFNPKLWETFDFVGPLERADFRFLTVQHIFIPELATAMAQLFDVVLQPKIGEVTEFELPAGPPKKTSFSYLRWRIPATKWTHDLVDVPALLERLTILACRLLKSLEDLDPLLLSIRPMHLDPHDRNVLIRDSHFAGLVDWQVWAMPAFMAAEYPPYLRHDGMYDDRYASLNEFGCIRHMNPQLRPEPDEAERLCALYLAASEKKSPLYARALQEGKLLRQLVEWLDFVEWDGNFVWAGLELWEADRTAAMARHPNEG